VKVRKRLHRNQAAGLSQRLQLVEPATVDLDEIAAVRRPLRFVGDAAERERPGNRLEGFGADGDADQGRVINRATLTPVVAGTVVQKMTSDKC
jgi:hypothetical protein